MKVQATATPEHGLVCLPCAKQKRARRRFRMALTAGAVLIGTGYAGYCVYQQRIVTFTEVAHSARHAIDWLGRRDHHDGVVQHELAAVRRELTDARRERDEARRDRKTLIEQQRRMEQALKGCIYRPSTPPDRRRNADAPFGGLFGF